MPNRIKLIGAAGALFLLGSCTSLPHNPQETYILVTANAKVPYWQTALSGLNHAANEMKVKAEMVGPDAYDPKAEHEEFQHTIARKPSGILVSSADAALLEGDINAAVQQGIPVITIDSDVPTSKRLLFVGTDNFNAGVLGGQLLLKLLNGKGNVVVFSIPNQSNINERLHGYQSALEGHGVKISQVVDMKGDPTIAFDTAKQLLDSKQKVDAFVCLEAISCPEVGEVIHRSNMDGKVVVLAMDTDQRTLSWIQKGVISATVGQKPYTMAYFATKLLDELHHNPPKSLTEDTRQNSYALLPMFVDTGTFIIDKDNLTSFMQEAQSHDAAH